MLRGRGLLAAVSVSLVNFVVGFFTGYTSPAIASMTKDLDMNDDQISWVGSIMPLAALFGGLFGGKLMDVIGRRSAIAISDALFALSWLLIALAPNVYLVLVARALAGFSIGIATLTIPVYLAETIPPESRGAIMMLPSALGNLGTAFCYIIGCWLNWKELAWAGFMTPLPILVLILVIPETPLWYLEQGMVEESHGSIVWLTGGSHGSVNIEEDTRSMHSIISSVPTVDFKIHKTLHKYHLKPFVICMTMMFFQQLSGINAVIFYSETIFSLGKSSELNPNLCSIILGIVNFLSSLSTIFLIDRLGRKILLYISISTAIVTLCVLGVYFHQQHNPNVPSWLPLVSLVLYIIGFSLGLGPIPWLLMGEILPLEVRNHAAALITAFNWLLTFIVTLTFNYMLKSMKTYGTFWMFSSIEILALLFTIKYVPETKDKTLEEIQEIYNY